MTSHDKRELGVTSEAAQLRRSGLLTLVGNIAAQALTATAAIAYARAGGPIQYGIVSVALGYVAVLSDLADFGTSQYIVRELASSTLSIRSALRLQLTRLKVGTTLSLVALTFTLTFGLGTLSVAASLSLYLSVFVMSAGFTAIARAANKFALTAASAVVERAVVVVAVLSALKIGYTNPAFFLLSMSAGSTVSALIVLKYLHQVMSGASSNQPDETRIGGKAMYWGARHLGLAGLSTDLSSLEVPAVAAASTSAVAGQFGAASRLSGPFNIPIAAMGIALLPRVSAYAYDRRRAFGLVLSLWWIVVGLAMALASVALFAGPLTRVVLGSDYGESTVFALRLVCLAGIVASINQLLYVYLQGIRAERALSRCLLTAVPLGIGFSALGARLGGAGWAAFGGVIANAIVFAWLVTLVRQSLLEK